MRKRSVDGEERKLRILIKPAILTLPKDEKKGRRAATLSNAKRNNLSKSSN